MLEIFSNMNKEHVWNAVTQKVDVGKEEKKYIMPSAATTVLITLYLQANWGENTRRTLTGKKKGESEQAEKPLLIHTRTSPRGKK